MASFYPLADWTTLAVEGGDRSNWLQNLCTNDLRRVSPGAGCETFVTDVKGKVLGHLYILCERSRLLLVTVPGQAEQLLSHLDRYIIREEVRLSDVSEQFAWRLIHDVDRAAPIQTAVQGLDAVPTEPWQHFSGRVGEHFGLVVNSEATIAQTHWLATSPSGAADLEQTLHNLQVTPMSEDAFVRLRVESAWPLWGKDFDAENLPQEVGRNEQAISFTKGCYLGQETVARIDALGHVNRQLAQIRFAGHRVAAVGDELLLEEKPVGKVTTAGWSDEANCAIALAMLRRGAEAAGVELQSRVGPAVVISR